uniref:Protein kinase domain-containing protein n=1 Tax=Macrostomum lignano TaxID=282301 RepID=A0A1I8H298_9PLAT
MDSVEATVEQPKRHDAEFVAAACDFLGPLSGDDTTADNPVKEAGATAAKKAPPCIESSSSDENDNEDNNQGNDDAANDQDDEDDEDDADDMAEFQPKPQPNLSKSESKMPDFFDQLESEWVGSFNERMSVPYKDYDSSSALGKINWDHYALVENDESIRKGHHAICPLIRNRKTGQLYRCKIVSCSRIHFNLTTLGFKEQEYDEEIRSYLLERQFLFAFDHPFVRNGLGFFTDNNFNFGVLMEDFPHGTLLDYYEKLESGKIVCQFKEEEVRMIAAQIILALEYLHSVGCVHRDIQASNILVDARGYIKLTDFAITTTLKPGDKLFSVTCFRYYAAPEYFSDKGYGYPVDFYAFGLMLYELLTRECFSDQEDIFDCDGSVDWGILPEELAALLRERKLAEKAAATMQGSAAVAVDDKASNDSQLLPEDHAVPSEPARNFVDDCLIYEPEFRPDRNCARFYDWFDGIDFEKLYCKTLDLPWQPTKIVSYQAKPDEEYPLSLILDDKPVPPELQPFTHLF